MRCTDVNTQSPEFERNAPFKTTRPLSLALYLAHISFPCLSVPGLVPVHPAVGILPGPSAHFFRRPVGDPPFIHRPEGHFPIWSLYNPPPSAPRWCIMSFKKPHTNHMENREFNYYLSRVCCYHQFELFLHLETTACQYMDYLKGRLASLRGLRQNRADLRSQLLKCR